MISHRFPIDGGAVEVRSSDRFDGSFALDEPPQALRERRRRLLGSTDRAWSTIRQVHGCVVHDPDSNDLRHSNTSGSAPEADAAVTFAADRAVAVLSADCAPVVLVGSHGVAAVHAGWRGAVAGVIDRSAAALRSRGAEPVATYLGPCIQPDAYEFGAEDLSEIVAMFGPEVVGESASGTSALDLTRLIQLSCERSGWPVPERPPCTSNGAYFSHRTRGDRGRQTTVAWIEHAGGSHAA